MHTPDYREIEWTEGQSPADYAARVLVEALPTFTSRDLAMEALALSYPFVTDANLLLKIGAAVYFTRRGSGVDLPNTGAKLDWEKRGG